MVNVFFLMGLHFNKFLCLIVDPELCLHPIMTGYGGLFGSVVPF